MPIAGSGWLSNITRIGTNLTQILTRKWKIINEAYDTHSDATKRRKYDISLGCRSISPKFYAGNKVRVIASDTFRFWYTLKFEPGDLAIINQFAEEERAIIEE
jgi:curved DNA-binding protein CbpA